MKPRLHSIIFVSLAVLPWVVVPQVPVPVQFATAPVLAGTGGDAVFTVQTVTEVFSVEWVSPGGMSLGQWIDDAASLNSVGQYQGRVAITATQLTIGAVQMQDAGNYTVNVSPLGNTGLTINSASAQLRVFVAVDGVSVAVPSDAAEGANATLRCSWTQGTEPTVTWMKDGAAVTPDSRITISSGSLTFNPVRRGDAGQYTCNVSNPISARTATATLTVFYGPDTPTVNRTTRAQCVGGGDSFVGGTVGFACNAVSLPPAIFSWQLNGQPLTFGQQDGGELSLQITTTDQSGQYTCIARNSVTGGSSQQRTNLTVVGTCLSGGAIAGIVIACVVALIIIIVVIVLLVRQRNVDRRLRDVIGLQKTNQNPTGPPPPPNVQLAPGARGNDDLIEPPLHNLNTHTIAQNGRAGTLNGVNDTIAFLPSGTNINTLQRNGNLNTSTLQPNGILNTSALQPNGNLNTSTLQPNGNLNTNTLQPSGIFGANTLQPNGHPNQFQRNSNNMTNAFPYIDQQHNSFPYGGLQNANTAPPSGQQNPNIIIQTGQTQPGTLPPTVHVNLSLNPNQSGPSSQPLNNQPANGAPQQSNGNLIQTHQNFINPDWQPSAGNPPQVAGGISAREDSRFPRDFIQTGYSPPAGQAHTSHRADDTQRPSEQQSRRPGPEQVDTPSRDPTSGTDTRRQRPWDLLRGTPAYPNPESRGSDSTEYQRATRQRGQRPPSPMSRQAQTATATRRTQTDSRSVDGDNQRRDTRGAIGSHAHSDPDLRRPAAQQNTNGHQRAIAPTQSPRAPDPIGQVQPARAAVPQNPIPLNPFPVNHVPQTQAAQPSGLAPAPAHRGVPNGPGPRWTVPRGAPAHNPSTLTQAALQQHTQTHNTFPSRVDQTRAALQNPGPQAARPNPGGPAPQPPQPLNKAGQHPPTPPPVLRPAEFQALPRERLPQPRANQPVPVLVRRPHRGPNVHTSPHRQGAIHPHAHPQRHPQLHAHARPHAHGHPHPHPAANAHFRQDHRGRPRH